VATQTLTIPYAVNSKLVFTKSEMASKFLMGIPLTDALGNPLPDEDIEFHVLAAQTEVENFLSIKLTKTLITESRSFWIEEWDKRGYINSTFPVVEPISMKGYFNSVLVSEFPKEWIAVAKPTSQGTAPRHVNLIPAGGRSIINFYTTFIHTRRLFGNMPNYWELKYVTGFDKIPADLLNYIGKLAACNVLPALGNSILASRGLLGIGKQYIQTDGLTQSVDNVDGGRSSAYAGIINAYQKDLERTRAGLRARYGRYILGSL